MITRYTQWATWVIPGLLAVSQFSVAAENNGIDSVLPDDDSAIEVEPAQPEQATAHEEQVLEIGSDSEANDDTSAMIETPRIRFGSGYEYRQSLRPETIERPDLPERPQIPTRPELPDLPGRFGR